MDVGDLAPTNAVASSAVSILLTPYSWDGPNGEK